MNLCRIVGTCLKFEGKLMERSRSEVQLDFMFGLGCGPCKLTVLLVWVKIRYILTGKKKFILTGV